MAKIEILGVWCESHKSHICACSFEWNKSLLQMDSTNNYLDRDALKSENEKLKKANGKLAQDLEEAVAKGRREVTDYCEESLWSDCDSIEKSAQNEILHEILSRFPVEEKRPDETWVDDPEMGAK